MSNSEPFGIPGDSRTPDNSATVLFDIDGISRRIISSVQVSDIPSCAIASVELTEGEITAGASLGLQDVLPARTFLSRIGIRM
jgi:hypothetical protein